MGTASEVGLPVVGSPGLAGSWMRRVLDLKGISGLPLQTQKISLENQIFRSDTLIPHSRVLGFPSWSLDFDMPDLYHLNIQSSLEFSQLTKSVLTPSFFCSSAAQDEGSVVSQQEIPCNLFVTIQIPCFDLYYSSIYFNP